MDKDLDAAYRMALADLCRALMGVELPESVRESHERALNLLVNDGVDLF